MRSDLISFSFVRCLSLEILDISFSCFSAINLIALAQSLVISVEHSNICFSKSCIDCISLCDPIGLAMQLSPKHAASSTAIPKPSINEGLSNASAFR